MLFFTNFINHKIIKIQNTKYKTVNLFIKYNSYTYKTYSK